MIIGRMFSSHLSDGLAFVILRDANRTINTGTNMMKYFVTFLVIVCPADVVFCVIVPLRLIVFNGSIEFIFIYNHWYESEENIIFFSILQNFISVLVSFYCLNKRSRKTISHPNKTINFIFIYFMAIYSPFIRIQITICICQNKP